MRRRIICTLCWTIALAALLGYLKALIPSLAMDDERLTPLAISLSIISLSFFYCGCVLIKKPK